MALQNIIARHEILRTTFHHLPGLNTPIQVILDNNSSLLEHYDLTGKLPQEQIATVEELFNKAQQIPIASEQEIPLHLSLIALSSQKHILLISLPTLCADRITFRNLMLEISH